MCKLTGNDGVCVAVCARARVCVILSTICNVICCCGILIDGVLLSRGLTATHGAGSCLGEPQRAVRLCEWLTPRNGKFRAAGEELHIERFCVYISTVSLVWSHGGRILLK